MFLLTYISDDFPSAALNLICLPPRHGDRSPSFLPVPSLRRSLSIQQLATDSLLIDQKPIGDKDLQCLDMQIPNLGAGLIQSIGTNPQQVP